MHKKIKNIKKSIKVDQKFQTCVEIKPQCVKNAHKHKKVTYVLVKSNSRHNHFSILVLDTGGYFCL